MAFVQLRQGGGVVPRDPVELAAELCIRVICHERKRHELVEKESDRRGVAGVVGVVPGMPYNTFHAMRRSHSATLRRSVLLRRIVRSDEPTR